MKFDGITIVTDMDGTLLREDKTISEKTLKKIEYFKENGGNFTIATGRLYTKIEEYFKMLSLNAPVISSNGAVIYDFLKNKVLYLKTMDPKCLKVAKNIMERFPKTGVEVSSVDRTHFIRESETVWKHIKDENYESDFKDRKIIWEDIMSITSPITKIMFCANFDETKELEAILPHTYSQYHFYRSDVCYYEMAEFGISKGIALLKLAEILGNKNKKIYAVGDNMNDIEMIKAADVGVCVKNAHDKVKNEADFILPYTNEEDAVCRLIELIEKGLI